MATTACARLRATARRSAGAGALATTAGRPLASAAMAGAGSAWPRASATTAATPAWASASRWARLAGWRLPTTISRAVPVGAATGAGDAQPSAWLRARPRPAEPAASVPGTESAASARLEIGVGLRIGRDDGAALLLEHVGDLFAAGPDRVEVQADHRRGPGSQERDHLRRGRAEERIAPDR